MTRPISTKVVFSVSPKRSVLFLRCFSHTENSVGKRRSLSFEKKTSEVFFFLSFLFFSQTASCLPASLPSFSFSPFLPFPLLPSFLFKCLCSLARLNFWLSSSHNIYIHLPPAQICQSEENYGHRLL